jgi:hypothetical protein
MPLPFQPGGPNDSHPVQPLPTPMKRRAFFQYAGATAGATALVLAGCKDDTATPPPTVTTVDVGAADNGVLNYAYALEQLEAAFYAQLQAGTYYTGLTATSAEKQILDDLAKHEKIHADFLKAAISGGSRIRVLETDFSSIDFNTRLTAPGATRMGVLNAAMAFEDLGVAAYNGAARYATSPLTLAALGKIVSVEARHAALIRDLISYNSFVASDVVDRFTPAATNVPGDGTGTGLEKAKTPTQVVAVVNAYFKEGSKLTVNSLV